MTCCKPKRFPVAGTFKLRHTCKDRHGQPYTSEDTRQAARLVERHRLEDASTGLDLHPSLQGSSIRSHFNLCTLGEQCELCAYIWDRLDENDDSSVVVW